MIAASKNVHADKVIYQIDKGNRILMFFDYGQRKSLYGYFGSVELHELSW